MAYRRPRRVLSRRGHPAPPPPTHSEMASAKHRIPLHHANWLCTDLSQPGTSPAETAQASRNDNRPDPVILRASVMPTVPQSTPNRLGVPRGPGTAESAKSITFGGSPH